MFLSTVAFTRKMLALPLMFAVNLHDKGPVDNRIMLTASVGVPCTLLCEIHFSIPCMTLQQLQSRLGSPSPALK